MRSLPRTLPALREAFVAIVLVAAAFSTSHCSTNLSNCVLQCGPSGACPDGQHCDHGYCTSDEQRSCERGEEPREIGGSSAEGGSAGSASPPSCVGDDCDPEPSCEDAETCGPPSCHGLELCEGVSCCESIETPGGVFQLGRGNVRDGYDQHFRFNAEAFATEVPEHPAYVSTFRLDRFEVTVGRFRKFVENYASVRLRDGDGGHGTISGSGWDSTWAEFLPRDRKELEERLACSDADELLGAQATYTEAGSENEQLPVVCVDWYSAFAFCVWDGGRLPTETEWEYGASGGDENRLYPWGAPHIFQPRAAYDCLADGEAGCAAADLQKVGQFEFGRAAWGHDDLAGNAWEWVLDVDADWYGSAGADCNERDCARLDAAASSRGVRGGGFTDPQELLRAAHRAGRPAKTLARDVGFRCARERVRPKGIAR